MKKGWRRRGDIIYYYWYDSAAKKQREVSTGTSDMRLAERLYGKLMAQLEGGGDSALMMLPFSALAERYKKEILPTKAKSTQRSMANRIDTCLTYFSGMRACDVTDHHVISYKAWREGAGITGSAIQVELSNLKSILNLADPHWKLPSGRDQRMQYLVKPRKIIRYFRSEEEWEAVRDACKEPIRSMVIAARFSGLRQANIINLEWAEVNLFKRVISIPPEKMKSGRHHNVPMNETLFQLFKGLKVEGRYVWPRPVKCSEQSWASRVYWHFKKAAKAGGRPDFRFHDLRHDFCSQLVMRGVPLIVVRDLAGHATVQMTEKYAHLAPSALVEHVKILDDLSGKTLANAVER